MFSFFKSATAADTTATAVPQQDEKAQKEETQKQEKAPEQKENAEPQQEQSDISGWLMSFFGGCTQAQQTGGDMKFDVGEENETGDATGSVRAPEEKKTGDATSGSSAPAAPAVLCKFKVDPSKLDAKAQKRPGLAYRSAKSEADKVKGGSHPSPAKFGDIVEGVDEGDGWVRVGEYFLPMMCKGVPVLVLVTDDEVVAPMAAVVPQQKQQQPWNCRPSVGTWHQRAVAFKHPEAGAPVAEEEAVCQQTAIAEEATEWNKLPSVGTWLQAPRKVWNVIDKDLVAKKVEEPVEIPAETFETAELVKEQQEKTEITADVAEQHAAVEVEEEIVKQVDETPIKAEEPEAEELKTREADETPKEEIVPEAAKQIDEKFDAEAVEATPKTDVAEDATPNTDMAEEEIVKMDETCEQAEKIAATEVHKVAEDNLEVQEEGTKAQVATEQGKDVEVEWAQTMEK